MLMVTENPHRIPGRYSQSEPDGPAEWSMIAVRTGKEPECCDRFRRSGVRCFWPNYYVFEYPSLSRRLRRSQRVRAIIPGYLFIPLPHGNAFHHVVEANEGLLNTVRNYSGDVLVLKAADIEVIRNIETHMNTPKPKASLHNFKTGQKVRLTDDLLGRWPPGRVGRLADDGRIVVEVEVMGRTVPFMVLPHQIERL
jgi:transcription antitermination factor NusG